MTDKIQIKNMNGDVLFECDKSEDDINQLAYAIRQAGEQDADLRGADLWGADLQGADLRGADLRGADLWGADLQGADLWGADLWGADLRGADLQGADLQGANLQGADLQGANLRGADLQGADLWGADLWGADLWGADLQGANLRGADLWGAYLQGANLRGAKNAPIIINGLAWFVIIDGLGKMRIGCQEHKVEEWKVFTDDEINAMDSHALEFWKTHKAMLLSLCDSYKHKDMNNIAALIETFGLASMSASDDKPTFEEVTRFEHSRNVLTRYGIDVETITQDEIDEAWDKFIKTERLNNGK